MKKGSALIIVVCLLALFSVAAVLFTKIVYNCYATANAALMKEQAFYLAEAGVEKGKVELANNRNWYTDLPYYLEDNLQWLAYYAVGQSTDLGDGSFKIVREKDKALFYSIGYKDDSFVVLKLKFSTPPFKELGWEEL